MIIGSKTDSGGGSDTSSNGDGTATTTSSGNGAATTTSAGNGSAGSRAPLVSGADRAALEEERDFLLASLRDLEAELEAGDISEHDYQSLRDDYTIRTAVALRALDAKQARPRPGGTRGSGDDAGPPSGAVAAGRGRRRWRRAAVMAAVVVVAGLAAWAVTASSGSRLANQPITGTFAGKNSPGGTTPTTSPDDSRLVQAQQLVVKGKFTDALKLYDQVLQDQPGNPEALANEGWLIAQAGVASKRNDLVQQGLTKIEAAEKSDASFPDAHFFRGALLYQTLGDPAGAVTEFREYLGLVDPTNAEVPQVEQMLSAAIAAAGPNVPPAPNAASSTGPATTGPATTSPPSTLAGPSPTS
jgi:hypothetical protein